MDRRDFFWFTGATVGGVTGLTAADEKAAELSADVVVIGGGLGGCAAALGAVREGATVIMTEETDWIGGQLTAQAVPPDEHKYIEKFGCPAEYRRLRNGARDFYRRQTTPALVPAARNNPLLNPGNGWVSRVCAEPRVWLTVLEAMLEPAVKAGTLRILRDWTPVSADAAGDKVRAVTGRTRDGKAQTLTGKYFLDATEQGDLLPLTGTEFVTGSEAQSETKEPSAGPVARPANVQSFTWVFALDHRPGEDHTIAKPAGYEFWRDHEPNLNPPTAAKRQLSWLYPTPGDDGKPRLGFDPTRDGAEYGPNLWTYRRAVDAKLFAPGAGVRDISLINWGQNDYHLGPLHAVPAAEAARHLDRGRQLSLALLYWLQTAAPRPDGKLGWPGLRLRPDVVGTEDGLAKRPYIRESRRLKAEVTVLEQHVSKPVREAEHTGKGPARAAWFADTIGVGLYLYIDIHASAGGDNGRGTGVLPFQIPLGALLPRRVENLLAASKNLGVTHITNGCFRLHTVEWGIGEAAGALAGFCVRTGELPRKVRADKTVLDDFQKRLKNSGVELEWPVDATN
ncbi:MAG: putative FAD-binding dehydrogenase [Gemmataceae bacterium]|nr:putative FAD-binding dehydrogenase [Gemmataceae bacterium]